MERKLVCPVCGDGDPEGKPLRRHYGAYSCYSCRAFFLRAHKRKKNDDFKCSGVGNCLQIRKEKQICQKCRMERCLEIGMDPKFIMSEDEKRERFKNYFKKKDEEERKKRELQAKDASSTGTSLPRFPRPILPKLGSGHMQSNIFATQLASGTGLTGTVQPQSLAQVKPVLLAPAASGGPTMDPSSITTSIVPSPINILLPPNLTPGVIYLVPTPVLQPILDLQMSVQTTTSSPSTSSAAPSITDSQDDSMDSDSKPELFDLLSILDSFSLAVEKLPTCSKPTQDLIQIHQNLKPISLQTFLDQLHSIEDLFKNFASSQAPFQRLCQEDQLILLKRNAPLYLQYITARYLTANSGLEQLTWILEGNLPQLRTDELVNLSPISYEEFVWEQFVFRSSELFGMYSDYLNMVKSFFTFPHYLNGLIANMLLYHAPESVAQQLKDPQAVESLSSDARSLAERELGLVLTGKSLFKLEVLVFALEQMKTIFDFMQMYNAEHFPAAQVPRQHSANFTETEQNWFVNKFERMQLQYTSVMPTEKMLQHVICVFNNACMVGPEDSGQWTSMMVERVRRTLKDQDEFQNLNSACQTTLVSKNLYQAVILAILKVNVAKTAKEQLKTFIGVINPNDTSWEAKFQGSVDLDNLTVVRMHQLEFRGQKLEEAHVRYITQLLSDVSGLFHDDQSFLLLLLLTFFDTEELPSTPAFQSISDVRKIYLRLFQRKLMSAQHSHADPNQLWITLNKLKILSKLFKTYVIEGFRR